MGSTFITDMLDILRDAGCQVRENADTNGWQSRSRSSGGFPGMPLGIQWHHTASQTSPENDVSYQVHGKDNPIGNCLLDRNGCYWPVAAGAANTAGKGGPLTLSRGTVKQDNANATTFAIEAANNGVGERWPCIQVDAYFAGSNALNRAFGNRPDDVFTHALGAGDGWTSRKIDPATCNVEGPWVPRSVNSSGTWSLADIRAECNARAGARPMPPQPQPPQPQPDAQGDEVLLGIYSPNGTNALYVCYSGGTKLWITDDGMWNGAIQLCQSNGISADPYPVELGFFAAMGVVTGPIPDGHDAWGNPC